MEFVLFNQFYPPDTAPTGLYLHDLARALVARGHRVRVLASQHAYAGGGQYPAHEGIDGVEVVRLAGFAFGREHHAGKLADYAAYYARLAADLIGTQPPDLILALTTPPFVGLLAAMAARLGRTHHAHWVMDLYPDVMHAHGMVSGAPLSALERLARLAYADADAIITLGPAMAERTRAYAGPHTEVGWIPLWTRAALEPWSDATAVPLRHERGWPTDRLVLLYSGNFGLGHRFGEFLEVARELGPNGPIWAFAGQGRARAQVERFAQDHPALPFAMLAAVPPELLREHLCSADVHLVSMDSRWEGTLLPSKLQASFAVGKPVIFVGGATQDIARWITEADAGWVVPEGDTRALRAAVEQAQDAGERRRRGRNGAAYARARFDATQNLHALVDLCERAARAARR
jgi:glycosyltransferase involved in cell wall biosynthesis